MSDNTAPQLLASFFRRWSDMEDRKAEIAEEGKELSAEMKSAGFDSKAIRAVFRDKRKELNSDPAEVQEAEAIYSLYWSALTNALSEPRAHPAPAHVEIIEQFDAETGEITELGGKQHPVNPAPAASAANEIAAPIHERPSTNDKASLEAGLQAEASLAGIGSRTLADREGRSEGEAASVDLPTHSPSVAPSSSQAATETAGADTVPPSAPATYSEDYVPAFLRREAKPLSPNCQNPTNCAGYGSHTCHACTRAAESEAA